VQTGLAHQPGGWVGRTVRVRGIATLCLSSDSHGDPPYCRHGSQVLLDTGGANAALPLAGASQGGVLALLRRVPLLGGLLPAPQAVRWEEVASYRVALRAMPVGMCAAPPCHGALLLDAAP
jgi:hypothetical protein